MRTSIRTIMLAATCLAAILLIGNLGSPAFAAGQTASEPLSKTYRVTRANDVEFQKVEPFKVFDNLYYVGPGYVSVWLVERYQIDLSDAANTSKEQMEEQITAMCDSEVPGDTHRGLQVDAHFFDRTFKHILGPIWLLTYNYGARTYHVVVNGYTGAIAGDHPLSFWKVLLAVLGAIALALVIFYFVANH